MIFVFSNPSDPYHFEAPDLEIAFVVTIILGNGKGAATCIEDESIEVPLFMFGNKADPWCISD